MKNNSADLSSFLRENGSVSWKTQLSYVWKLSIPGILAQISSIVMQYIDAAMVGSLGADASAAIGLVASTTWLFGGISHAAVMGFTVQVAQFVGAAKLDKARSVLCQSIIMVLVFSLMLGTTGGLISPFLPSWLGAEVSIHRDSSIYFMFYAVTLPFMTFNSLMGGMLQCSGNMKVPSILNASMCGLDVVFNYIFIFVLNMGVAGAAIGTMCSQIVICILMTYFTVVKSKTLNLRTDRNWKLHRTTLTQALRVSLPMAFEQTAVCGAMVAVTRIVAPLGSVSIAANSFAVTAESLCFMPGYGIQEAATTLVGQSIGASRKDYAKHFAWMTTIIGMLVMTATGILMYFACPFVFKFLTPVLAVQELGVKVLRLELFAEPLFAVSIVANGSFRATGDTLIPSILNLISIWGVRLTASVLLAPVYGLTGVWIAMCAELCFRGILFLTHLAGGRWLKKGFVA